MDPLSITASVVALGTLATQVTAAFVQLRTVSRNLPGRLHALGNDITDLTAVLKDIEATTARPSNLAHSQQTSLPPLLQRLREQLTELESIVLVLTDACSRSKVPLVKARQWSKVQGKLQMIQEDIRTQKSHLLIALSSSISRDLLHVRLDLAAVSMTSTAGHQLIDERLTKLEEIMNAEKDRLHRSRPSLVIPEDVASSHEPPAKQRQLLAGQTPLNPRSDAVGVRVRKHIDTCSPACACVCHKQSWAGTPELLRRVLGQLFVDYSGIPVMSFKCNDRRCRKGSSPYLDLEYWFPAGMFWSKIIRLHFAYQAQLGPQVALETLRRVPDDAPAVAFAVGGNIDGMKDLFRRNLAHPRDVSESRGYSLIRWAVYDGRFEMCKFLIEAGADADYCAPLSYNRNDAFQNSARNTAHTILLAGNLPSDVEAAVRLITRDSDFTDEQEFTPIHKAVLGLSFTTVEEAIQQNPSDLDTKDNGGRTPLAWAASRKNAEVVALLLSYGADPNTICNHGTTPLYNITQQYNSPSTHAASAECCRLLLEAGAVAEPNRVPGSKGTSPMINACVSGNETTVARLLLDYGGSPDSNAGDGRTALHHIARRGVGYERNLQLLLDAGANINAESHSGETPLSTAITFNSHSILKVLLDRWFEYSECPRLKGSNLLALAAKYADIETVRLLVETDHIRLEYDESYSAGVLIDDVAARSNGDENLVQAFRNLLAIVNEKQFTGTLGPDSLMESGLRKRTTYEEKDYLIPGSWRDEQTERDWDEWEDEAFEDAISEGMHLKAGATDH